MKIASSIIDLIGNTPLLNASRLALKYECKANILVKIEGIEPSGSVKARTALSMLERAEKRGELKKGSVIIEATSGNTGIALAAIAKVKGYKVILTMPDTMSKERIDLLKAYGAEVVLTEGKLGMNGAVQKAIALKKEMGNAFIPDQFSNEDNCLAHISTASEIYEDTDGKVDIFVCGIGTGGTFTGTVRELKKKKDIYAVAVEPKSSPLLSEGKTGPHGLQGIGPNFVPSILDEKLIDELVDVEEEQAYSTCRALVECEGLPVGISAGAALYAALKIGAREENKGKNIVVILPDGADKYLSTGIY